MSVRMVVVGGRRLIEFAVKDSGVTLASAVLQSIFMRPVTFKREAVGGMGLGMCCLAARLNALGGTYGARGRLDSMPGTVVWFRIPFVPCKEGQKAPRSALLLQQPVIQCEGTRASGRGNPRGSVVMSGTMSGTVGVAMGTAISATVGPTMSAKAGLKVGTIVPEVSASALGTIAQSDAPRSNPVSTPVSIRTVDKPLQGRAILVVDDAPTIVKVVVRQLINAGATVESAKDGRDGVEMFKAAEPPYDIVITDIQVLLSSLPTPLRMLFAYRDFLSYSSSCVLLV
jgi:CheY-like chemotaxis protein